MNITQQSMELLDFLKNYWVVIVFIGGTISTWTMFRVKMQEHEKRIISLEEDTNKLNISHAEVMARLARIEALLEILVDERKK